MKKIFSLCKSRCRIVILLIFGFLYFQSQAQVVKVVDNKGTIFEVNNNQVTTAATAPTTAVEGDVWFDTITNITKIWDGTIWKEIDSDQVTTAATAPTTPVVGDVWFDTTTNISKIWDGTVWKEIASDFISSTTHISSATPLTDAHSTTKVHIESSGSVSIDGATLSNGFSTLIINHSGATSTINFSNFAGVFELNTSKSNITSNGNFDLEYLESSILTITESGVNKYLNISRFGGADISSVPLWKSNTNGGAYSANDIVNHGGSLYKNLVGVNTDTTPDIDVTNWEKIVENIQSLILEVSDVAVPQNPFPPGTRVIATNVANIDFSWGGGIIAGLEEGDVIELLPSNDWRVVLDVSNQQTPGNYQVYDITENTIYYYTGNQWSAFGAGGGGNSVPLWQSNTNGGVYVQNEIINHGGVLYKNLTGTNTDTTPNADTTNWTLVDKATIKDWINNTNGGTYAINDLVSYNGNIYKNLTGSNTDTAPDTDITNWKSIGDIVPLWISNTNGGSYSANDIVNYNGTLYKNLTGTNTDTAPNSDAANWVSLDIRATAPKEHMYTTPIAIYQDIVTAAASNVVQLLGNPTETDFTTYATTTLFNGRHIYKYGGNNENDGNGMEIAVPANTRTVWVRFLGDRWNVVKAYYLDGANEDLGRFVAGNRASNNYVPGGGTRDGEWNNHEWMPIPVPRSGRLALIPKTGTSDKFWVSGIAFSSNPHNHAHNPAVAYNFTINGGTAITWDGITDNDQLGHININTTRTLEVPVVENGSDKILYFVTRGQSHTMLPYETITVEGTVLTERLRFTHDNPFSRHWRISKQHGYAGVRVPASLIPSGATHITVDVKVGSAFDWQFFFREAGTHDIPERSVASEIPNIDTDGNQGVAGQVLRSTGTGTDWVDDPSQSVLPIHADNAAALTAGLVAGNRYHNGDGVVRVVF